MNRRLIQNGPALAASFALLSLLVQGYRFGVADHGIHLPFVAMGDGGWDGDLLALARPHHPTLLWGLLGLFGPGGFFALHLATLFAVGLAIVGLTRTLFRAEAAPLALLALTLAWPALGGANTADPLVLNRTVALPVELFGVLLWLRGRSLWGFALVGLAACIHAPSAAVLAGAMAIAGTWRGGLAELRGPAVALLLALPVVVPWLLGGGSVRVVDPAWAAVLDARMSHHLDARSWAASVWLAQGALLLAGGVAFRWARPRAGVGALGLALIGVGIAVGGLLGTLGQLSLALQLEAWQAFRFVSIGCVLLAAGALSGLGKRGLGAGTLIVLGLAIQAHPDTRWQPLGPGGEQAELGHWMQQHLPETALIAVPPDSFDELRPLAERAFYVTWKDGGEALFNRDVALEWTRRVEIACACRPFDAPLPAAGRLGVLRARMREGSESADPWELARSLRAEGVTHLILRSTSEPSLDEPPLLRTASFHLYSLAP